MFIGTVGRFLLALWTLCWMTSASPSLVELEPQEDTHPKLGDDLQLICEIHAYSQSPKPVTWKFNNIIIDIDDYHYSSNSTKLGVFKLTVYKLTPLDQGLYECVVALTGGGWGGAGGGAPGIEPTMKSDSYELDLDLAPTVYINHQPYNEMRFESQDNVTVLCAVYKDTKQIYWTFTNETHEGVEPKNYHLHYGTDIFTAQADTEMGWSKLTLTFKKIRLQQDGQYKCFTRTAASSAVLHVNGTELSCERDKYYANIGYDVTVKCYLRIRPRRNQPNVIWEKIKQSQITHIIPNSNFRFRITDERLDNLTTICKLSIANVQPQDFDFKYALRVGNQRLQIKLEQQQGDCMNGCSDNRVCEKDECVCRPGFKENNDDTCVPEGPGNGSQGASGGSDKVVVVKNTSVATILGSAGGALLIVLLVLAGYICYRRRKSAKKMVSQTVTRDPYYTYEYHSEAIAPWDNPAFNNPNYQPLRKPPAQRDDTCNLLSRDELEFPRNKLQLGVDLGQGRFGKVIQARAMGITGSGKWVQVAVKTCRATATDTEKQDLYHELDIMRKLPRHINIISLLGWCSKTEPLYIIMEYAHRGSLMDYLRKCRPSSVMSHSTTRPTFSFSPALTEPNTRSPAFSSDSGYTMSIPSSTQTLSTLSGRTLSTTASVTSSFMQPRAKDLTIFALQIARGMAHVASCGIIHRDLAARNILLATDFTCKICDFGLARDVEGVDVYERTSKGPLPIRWMAPESLVDHMFTRKSDVWSYGVLLWEIVTLGATPYSGMSAVDVMRYVTMGQLLQRPLHCKEEMYELMVKCWEKENSRPTFADIVEHHEALMDDDYIVLSDYDENDYGWLESYTTDERR